MTNKELFEHYVNLAITDISISNCNKTDFSTYGGYATYINGQLTQQNFSTINRYLYEISSEIEELYGMSEEESIKYVVDFFFHKKWERYHKAVNLVRGHFGIFLSQ